MNCSGIYGVGTHTAGAAAIGYIFDAQKTKSISEVPDGGGLLELELQAKAGSRWVALRTELRAP
eukprot:scaffold10406_cov140-Cylindrotheca_fusiformis.AAC.2